jgi:hypothetical protein
VIVDEAQNAQLFFEHFDAIMGNYEDRTHGLDFHILRILVASLGSLDHCFSKEEVWNVIHAMPPYKASGPDGFTTLFFKNA